MELCEPPPRGSSWKHMHLCIWLRAHNLSIPNRKFLIRNFHGFLKGILPFLVKFLEISIVNQTGNFLTEISMVFSERVFYPKKNSGNFLTEISMIWVQDPSGIS